ncbi:hypothetical protein Tco_1324933 [Tanacetum coccineum]
MGGAMVLLLHRKKPEYWDGGVLVAPMCKVNTNKSYSQQESVIGINKDDIDEEDDESSTMEPPSRNEAIKVQSTLNNSLSYEKQHQISYQLRN